MTTPLAVKVPMTRVTPKKPGNRMDYSGTPSVADKNRVEPKTKVTNRTKAALEVNKPNKTTNSLKSAKVQKVGYTAPREEIPFTVRGYPRSRFKGQVPPNVPL